MVSFIVPQHSPSWFSYGNLSLTLQPIGSLPQLAHFVLFMPSFIDVFGRKKVGMPIKKWHEIIYFLFAFCFRHERDVRRDVYLVFFSIFVLGNLLRWFGWTDTTSETLIYLLIYITNWGFMVTMGYFRIYSISMQTWTTSWNHWVQVVDKIFTILSRMKAAPVQRLKDFLKETIKDIVHCSAFDGLLMNEFMLVFNDYLEWKFKETEKTFECDALCVFFAASLGIMTVL